MKEFKKSVLHNIIEKSIHTKDTQAGFDLSLGLVFTESQSLNSDGWTLVNPIEEFYDFEKDKIYKLVCNERIKTEFYPEWNKDNNLMFFHRSSINRMGGWIGTDTTFSGEIICYLQVTRAIKIQRNSRILQVVATNKDTTPRKSLKLTLNSIESVSGGVLSTDKTIINPYVKLEATDNTYRLQKCHTYVFECNEGCEIGADEIAYIQRWYDEVSPIFIKSPVFDSGFKTEKCKIMVYIEDEIELKVGDEICELNFYVSEVPTELYNGQFQQK